MSLVRRWFDPIRSRWLLQRPVRRQHHHHRDAAANAAERGLVVYLRLDDVYSYLLVQILAQLDDLLIPRMRPIRLMLATTPELPDGLTPEQWQRYSYGDAAVLARQHRFVFPENTTAPDPELMQQALDVLRLTPFRDADFLHLLQNVFHMVWQGQSGKLALLQQMALRRVVAPQGVPTEPPITWSDEPLEQAYITYGGRRYYAIDDFLRLTRKLDQQKLLTSEPVFLINHVEWGEHLVSDPEFLTEIQAMRPVLKFYGALEDPFTYLLLSYLQQEMVGYYNVKVKFFPLPYQGRDVFDWRLAQRLSKRIDVPFSPFCRPDEAGVNAMARALVLLKHEARLERTLEILSTVWTKGLDMGFAPHFQQVLPDVALSDSATATTWLERNQRGVGALGVPDLPAFVLRVGHRRHIFCSLYRVWQVETLLASALEDVV